MLDFFDRRFVARFRRRSPQFLGPEIHVPNRFPSSPNRFPSSTSTCPGDLGQEHELEAKIPAPAARPRGASTRFRGFLASGRRDLVEIWDFYVRDWDGQVRPRNFSFETGPVGSELGFHGSELGLPCSGRRSWIGERISSSGLVLGQARLPTFRLDDRACGSDKQRRRRACGPPASTCSLAGARAQLTAGRTAGSSRSRRRPGRWCSSSGSR